MRHLCDLEDVKRIFNYSGIYSDSEVLEEIESQSDDIYNEMGYPIAATITEIQKYAVQTYPDNYYYEYYLGEPRIHHIDRAFVGTTTKREIFEAEDFAVGKNVGMIKLNTSTVGGMRITDSDDLLVYYVPNLVARYCALRVACELIEQVDINLGEKTSKQYELITKKLQKHEELISQRIGVVFSSMNEFYDKKYGINQKRVIQDPDMNLYLWREDKITD